MKNATKNTTKAFTSITILHNLCISFTSSRILINLLNTLLTYPKDLYECL